MSSQEHPVLASAQAGVSDRREYFRVQDTIALRIDELPGPGAEINLPVQLQSGENLLRELHQIENDNALLLRSIQDKHRDIGQYLKSQSRRIELVARFFVLQHAAAYYTSMPVSLSGSGIAWTHKEALRIGDTVALHFILLQSVMAVSCRARVLACTKLDHGYAVRIEYLDINDTDRDAIVRHCLQVQAAERREQRDS